MTELELTDGLSYRPAREEDGQRLAEFECSTGAWFEDDVQGFIRSRALGAAIADGSLYRLVVVCEAERLAAVAGHHPEAILVSTAEASFEGVQATRLHVLALSRADHGRRIGDERLSDLVMRTLMSEAIAGRPRAILTAVVAMDNLRSIALCERHGLRSQIAYDARHLRLSGSFERA